MATMTLTYACPSGYFSGSTLATKYVSRTSVSGAPSDSYSLYKITGWSASFSAQVYPSAGLQCKLLLAGNAFLLSCGKSADTITYSGSGGSGSYNNAILDSSSNETLGFDFTRNASGSGNAALVKSDITITITYEYNYTSCSAPTNIWLDNSAINAGTSTNLNWSGASAGKNMSITKYEVYRATELNETFYYLGESVDTKLSVVAPETMGDSYYYKVKTIGSVSGYDSLASSAYATLTARTITNCATPTFISLTKVNESITDTPADEKIRITSNPVDMAVLEEQNATFSVKAEGSSLSYQWQFLPKTGEWSNTSITGYNTDTLIVQAVSYRKDYLYRCVISDAEGNSVISKSAFLRIGGAITFDCGESAIFSWSGASAGVNNPINGYKVYQSTDNEKWALYQFYETSSANGTISIPLNVSNDTTYYFKISTVGTANGYDSEYSSVFSAAVKTYTQCGNIPSASFPSNVAEGTALLTWAAAADGRNNPVSGYRIDYQDSADGFSFSSTQNLTTAAATTTQYACAVNPNRGQYRRFMITAVGTKNGFNSNTTTMPLIKTNQLPAVPTVVFPASGKTSNSDNVLFSLIFSAEKDGQSQQISYNLDGTASLVLDKISANGQTAQVKLKELASGQHTIKFRAYDGLAYSDYTDELTFTYSLAEFTDAKPTTVKAAHINELRAYINTLRAWYGKEAKDWKETITVGSTIVKASHWAELQDAINEVEPRAFTKVEKNGQIKKKILTELRNAVKEG